MEENKPGSLLKSLAQFAATASLFAVIVTNSPVVTANSRSGKFHIPGCKYGEKIEKRNRIYFSNPEEAVTRGYKPCRDCLSPGPVHIRYQHEPGGKGKINSGDSLQKSPNPAPGKGSM